MTLSSELTLALAALSIGIIVADLLRDGQLEEALEPLHELQVVHVLARDQTININMLVNAKLGEASLEELIVGNVFEVLLGRPVDLGHGDLVGVHDIQQLACNSSTGSIFNLLEIQFQRAVDPVKNFLAANEEGTFHNTNVRHLFLWGFWIELKVSQVFYFRWGVFQL